MRVIAVSSCILVLCGISFLVWSQSINDGESDALPQGAAPIDEQALEAARARRIYALDIKDFGNRNVTSIYVLTEDIVVVAFRSVPASVLGASGTRFVHLIQDSEPLLYALATRCSDEEGEWFYDGTFLVPSETVKEFYDKNLEYFNSTSEHLRYSKCSYPYMTLTSVRREVTLKVRTLPDLKAEVWVTERKKPNTNFTSPDGGFIWSIADRTIAHINMWALYLGSRSIESYKHRALDFLVFSLERQRATATELSRENNLEDLAYQLNFYDISLPISNEDLLGLDLPYSENDIKSLQRYFETMDYIRGKLEVFYPEQRELKERDRQLFSLILDKFKARSMD